jgi:hypothetical protein
MAAFNHSTKLPNYVERDGRWHHVAVTWTQANQGLTQVCPGSQLPVQLLNTAAHLIVPCASGKRKARPRSADLWVTLLMA